MAVVGDEVLKVAICARELNLLTLNLKPAKIHWLILSLDI